MRDKPILLMIHGLIGSLDYFDPQSRIEAAEVRTVDLLGYGAMRGAVRPDDATGRQSNPLTLDAQAEYVLQYLDQLGDDRVWLLGHSMGGAIAMLVADRAPERVAGIINVEGNFTLRDAFWSQRIAGRPVSVWQDQYRAMQADVPGWLRKCGVEPNEQRVGWTEAILNHQPAETLFIMSEAIMKETGEPGYLDVIRRVIDRDIPLHLIAGEKSANAWDVPDFVRKAATSYHEQPDVGHLMMLEEPGTFCRLIDSILG